MITIDENSQFTKEINYKSLKCLFPHFTLNNNELNDFQLQALTNGLLINKYTGDVILRVDTKDDLESLMFVPYLREEERNDDFWRYNSSIAKTRSMYNYKELLSPENKTTYKNTCELYEMYQESLLYMHSFDLIEFFNNYIYSNADAYRRTFVLSKCFPIISYKLLVHNLDEFIDDANDVYFSSDFKFDQRFNKFEELIIFIKNKNLNVTKKNFMDLSVLENRLPF